MKITRDIEYSIMSLVSLGETDSIISARELSKRFSIPYELLSKILQSLCQNGLVDSIKGPKGGYKLRATLNDISLGDIDEALHGSSSLVPCFSGNTGLCEKTNLCTIHHGMQKVQHLWEKMLSSISLEEFSGTGA